MWKYLNKSAIPVNIEQRFIIRAEFELTISRTGASTALSVTFTNCASETTPIRIVRVSLIWVSANTVHFVY